MPARSAMATTLTAEQKTEIKESFVTFQTGQGTDVRAGLLRLTRHAAVFEVYNATMVMRMSDVLENLKVFAGIYNVRDPAAKINELLERFGIAGLKNKPISRLSSGETTRVGLCKAFLNDPELLLLDEPTAYLDPQAAVQVREVLLDLQKSRGTTILYTSHNMHEVERVCDRILFLSKGSIIATGTPIEVTRAILNEDRSAPALEEVFIRIAERRPREAVSN